MGHTRLCQIRLFRSCAVTDRHRILVFNKFYLPGYRAGGPIRTLANMVDRLGVAFDFRVVTLDRDAGESDRYADIPKSWVAIGNAQVRYLSPREVSFRTLERIVQEEAPHVLYLNSFFDPVFAQRILWLRRMGRLSPFSVVLAPRGEFSVGALGLKAAKKAAYIHASARLGLYKGLLWQASSAHEKADIQSRLRFVRGEDIIEAMDLAPTHFQVIPESTERAVGAPLRVCFLSRISPMKNLDFALRALAMAKSEIRFTIYGPKELPNYWSECERLIAKLPTNVSVDYGGELHPTAVPSTLANHDFFFFPTRGENYGHVIHEALSAGLPVLVSDQTPWTDIPNRAVGWALPLNDEVAFARRIDDYASWTPEAVAEIRRRARSYALERSEDRAALAANRDLFASAIARRFA